MPRIHLGNRLEVLLDRLAEQISVPLADPLTPESILVQNPGMARWVSQGLAGRLGVAANLEFPLPARFFWEILGVWIEDLPPRSDWDRERLLWRIYARLPALAAGSDPAFAGPARFLQGEPLGLKTYQLAKRVADLFDQYLVYRPEMLLGWESGEDGPDPDSRWQAALWRALKSDLPAPHRAGLFGRLEGALAQGLPPRSALPERILAFGLSALPPIYCQVLAGLARLVPVHLFALSPCRGYWADLADEPRRARARARELGQSQTRSQAGAQTGSLSGAEAGAPAGTAQGTPASDLLDSGNPLLASWGRAGMAFQDQLIEMGGEPLERYREPGAGSLLCALQSDILELDDRRSADPQGRTPLDPADGSLLVHACHSPRREVQVLHDRLLRLFEELPDLRPRDILAMAPDIDVYAPHVESVFGGPVAAGEPIAIPWSIADRRLSAEQPLLKAVTGLLALPDSRLGASEVLDWLELPAIARRFGLDEPAVTRIRTWVAETGIRWGLDGAMRAGLELPGEDANSWAFGLRRLFLGYALPAPESGGPELHPLPEGAVLPYPDLEGPDAEALGGLQQLIDTLAYWREDLSRPRPMADWASALNRLLDDLLDPDQEEDALVQPLRETIDGLRADCECAGFEGTLGLDVLKAELADCLDGPAPVQRFLTGRVTFCNMVPMRSVPARVVCLLGLNGADFPRDPRPPAFDLMAAHPRRGDRSRREDDRWLFLESLLAARDCLHLSYVARDQRDLAIQVPSVPVDELLAYVRGAFRLPDGADPAERLVVRHPLQPFSRRCFDGADPRIGSFRDTWCRAAAALPEPGSDRFLSEPLQRPEAPTAPEPASELEPAELELEDLIRFLRCPPEWFLTRRLGLRPPEESASLDDTEPLLLEGLEAWTVRQRIFDLAEEGRGAEAEPWLCAAGLLPHGLAGELKLEQQAERVAAYRERLAPYRADQLEPLELDLPVGGMRLRGWLSGLGDQGLVVRRLGRARAQDLLALWVRHLALNLAAPPGIDGRSVLVAEDSTASLPPLEDPGGPLADLVGLYLQGQDEPLRLYPETSLAFARNGWDNKTRAAWEGGWNDRPGERDLSAVRTAFRGAEPLGPEFESLAPRVLGPLIAAMSEDD
jgi:exodeoxyribonuclease V gamma subunit